VTEYSPVDTQHKRGLWIVAILLVVVAIGYSWGRHWMASQLPSVAPIAVDVPGDCALHRGPCRVELPPGVVHIELSHEPVPLEPFRVQLHASMALERVSVDFQMVDMYMGVNRYDLKQQAPEIWSRQAMLPVCATGRSDWVMYARIEVDGLAYVAALPFEAAAAR